MLFEKLLLCCTIALVASDPIVSLPKGQVRGVTLSSVNNRTIHVFRGIPFAKPPIGKLRFKTPDEPEPWTDILDAIADSNICFSCEYNSEKESEDCLYLNVITPALELNETSKKLPVLFSIYGGGFRAGSAGYGNHAPDWWAENDIIYVNFNYRVGAFGFLTTGDLKLPGNYGLKDQQLALKWTYENIHLFGGDKDQITIHGQSAGGASVTYQILNKKSAGMFRAAIAESGSAFSGWAYTRPGDTYAVDLVSIMQNGTQPSDNSSTFIYDYLSKANAKGIDLATEPLFKAGKDALPTIEPKHEDAFITELQYSLMENGDFNRVPLIIGINSEENIFKAADLNSFKKKAETYDKNPATLLPKSLGVLSAENETLVGQTMKDVYAGTGRSFSENLGGLVAYLSDNSYTRPTIKFAEMQSQYTDVWFYQFSYKGKMGHQLDINIPGAEKVAHGEEVHYYTVYKDENYDNTKFGDFPKNDVLTHFRIIELWSNFIKYLDPTPNSSTLLSNITWPVITPVNYTYLNINATLELRTSPKSPRYTIWKQVFETFGSKPYLGF
ncbi:unnamed protein product [Ceutorhynchus assimilis]|uniref:Carboxylic ester hydrolase n=1 Tax=Ceutorhynchus assimilis TaxID=467358 RepID=A0A9N9MNR7_9CUCU|nr:unnamed protein product [Ceutorhynchus assimilis]